MPATIVSAGPLRELNAILEPRFGISVRRLVAVGPAAVPGDGNILVPIERRGSVIGAAEVAVASHSAPTDDVLHLAAAACAVILDGAELRRRATDAERRLAAVAERERIARGVHDRVTERIDTIAAQVAGLLERTREESWRRRLEELLALSYEADRDVREAAHALVFLEARRGALVPSLAALALRFEMSTGASCSLRVTGSPVALTGGREDALFRIAHEALLNVDRHARASVVTVQLGFGAAHVTLVVRDDGVGLGYRDPFAVGGQFGLRTMREHARAVGGTLRLAPADPRGVVVEASVPLPRRRAAGRRRR